MFDTHTHLQFKAFEGKVEDVIKKANEAGVEKIIVVGTNLETSMKAIELSQKHGNLFSSVGIHPHHVFGIKNYESRIMEKLEKMLQLPKVIAMGETGLDRHIYLDTKYSDYEITEEFIELQKAFFVGQIRLAVKYQKTLIIHNRKAAVELLEVLKTNWDPFLKGRSVFHFCEPDDRLLEFAIKNEVFIGVDGDVTFDKDKQKFVKKIPLNLLILETDSPFIVPEPKKSSGEKINAPENLYLIAQSLSQILEIDQKELTKIIYTNSLKLFNL